MSNYQSVFERREVKYLLTRQQRAALDERFAEHLTADRYGLHTICNLYFDTDTYQLIRTSIEKPVYKEKLRLRSYGVPRAGDPVFLELKKKFKHVVYKRRIAASLKQIGRYLDGGEEPQASPHILAELTCFLARYRPVPKVYIAYDRLALFSQTDPALRVTFDQNIRWRTTDLDLSSGAYGSLLIDGDTSLMEIKTVGAMPLWLCRTLSDLRILPTSFSKYGVCYEKHLFSQSGGMICA